MNEFFADLHVHIGRAENNKPIKNYCSEKFKLCKYCKRM